MEGLSDDEFDHVRDFDFSDVDEEVEKINHDTPATTPPRNSTPRPSSRTILTCPHKGCSKTFNRNARLEEHLRSHTGERPFKCSADSCDKTFMRETHLKRHFTSAHTDDRKYLCTWQGCDKSFSTGTRLRRHLASHEGHEKFRCRGYEGCNETFRKHETLKKHIATVHENKKPFPCEEIQITTGEKCTQAFQTAEKLRSHQRACHDSTRFSCEICMAQKAADCAEMEAEDLVDIPDCFFATHSDLQAHIKEAHPPTCQYCPTSFRSNKELTRHLELQHGLIESMKNIKQISCPHAGCQQVFTKQGNLNVHIKTVHEKQKDFVCGKTEIDIPAEVSDYSKALVHGCGRSFTSKASLVEHVRTAHFHLPNRRAQRKEEQRAKRQLESESFDGIETKRRAPRKDKGIKKSSVLTSLTGLDLLNAYGVPATTSTNILPSSYAPSSYTNLDRYHAEDVEDDEDDLDQLSGSMTMCGDHLYHQGQGYHVVSENNSVDSSMLDDVQYIPCDTNETPVHHDDDYETLFHFETDHGHRESTHFRSRIDPLLLST